MSALPVIEPDQATGTASELLTAVKSAMGAVPNMTKVMVNSPAVLKGYLELHSALGGGALSTPVRELIAVAVAQGNECGYCLSAHSFIAEKVAKLDGETITAARTGQSADPKTAAILALAVAVNTQRGGISDAELDAAKAAGLSDGEIAEVFANVALNVYTNYFNRAARTPIDFPEVAL